MTRTSPARGLAVFAVLGALALGSTTACASSGSTPAGGGTSASSPAGPGPTTGSPAPTLIPVPSVTPPAPSRTGVPSGIPAASYSSAGTVLTVNFVAGVCSTYSLLADQSTAGEVKVTIIATPTGPAGKMCPMLVKPQSVSTDLGSPLDGRTVLDTVSGKALHLASIDPVPGGGRMTHGPVKS